jgi:hypothetical protein
MVARQRYQDPPTWRPIDPRIHKTAPMTGEKIPIVSRIARLAMKPMTSRIKPRISTLLPPPTPPLAVLIAHRDVVPLVDTDAAVLNHPRIGPRLRAQNQQLRTLLTAPDLSVSARLRAEAALGAIWRPLIAEPPLDLTDSAHQHTLIDAAHASLQRNRPSPDDGAGPAAQSTRTASTRT